ncbi:hypothetical protein YC2023_049972 [Brassica napus]
MSFVEMFIGFIGFIKDENHIYRLIKHYLANVFERKKTPSKMELIEECWDAEAAVRPTISDFIVGVDRIFVH